MGKLRFGRVLDRFCLSPGRSGVGTSSCLCFKNHHSRYSNSNQEDDGLQLLQLEESKPLISPESDHNLVRLKDVISGPPTLALHLKPKMVVLKVSMHCNGCARKVEKHISRIEGVTSYQVDLETKMVVVIGDIVPFEVLESVSKVKTAQLWTTPTPT